MKNGSVDLLDPFEAFLAEFRRLPDGELLRAWRAEAVRKGDPADDGHHPRVRRQALLTVVGERFGVASLPGILRGRGDPSAGVG